MKKLIVASIEVDGHSSTSMFITTTEQEYEKAIRSLLYYEDELMYHFRTTRKINDNMIEQWYDSELGEMSIIVCSFSAYKQIENMEFYTRTG